MKYGTRSYVKGPDGILMIKKEIRKDDPNSGFYALPGGKLKSTERSNHGRLKSVLRETEEETGIVMLEPIFRGAILFDNKDRIFDNWPNAQDFLVYYFSSEKYVGNLKERTDEGIPGWILNKSLHKLPMNPGDKKIYEWLDKYSSFFGVIKHKGRELDEKNTFVDWI